MTTETTARTGDYLWRGRTGPFPVTLRPGVFVPSSTSMVLADALDVSPGDTVIDIGCGSGVLSFVAARLGADRVYGTDISDEAVAVARDNAARLELAERTEFRIGNLFEPVRDVRADVIIGDVSGIPDGIAEVTGWFPGGPTGAEMPVAMLEDVGDCLKVGGRFYLPTGSIQDQNTVLGAARRMFDALKPVAEREFPLPGVVARSKALARLLADGLVDLRQQGSRLLWKLTVWCGQRR